MPTNLPPHYFDVEKKLKAATENSEKIALMEELLSIIPKHKGTEKMCAMYKTKIAKLKASSQKKSATARSGPTYHIDKSGAGQVVIIGAPNAGKSQLVKTLTNADPKVGDFPFTTTEPYPAMMPFENIKVQLVDTPPITADYLEVWHHELIKAADGVIVVADLQDLDAYDTLQVIFQKLKERKIGFYETKPPEEKEEEILFYKKTLMLANKIDEDLSPENLVEVQEAFGDQFKLIPISSTTGEGIDELRRIVFEMLNVVRVYSKIPGKKVELKDPYTFKIGSNLMDMAKAVHKDFASKLKFARIWGKSKYEGQKVNRDYILEDEDVIELHM